MIKDKIKQFISRLENAIMYQYDQNKTNDSEWVVLGDYDTMRTISFYIDEVQVKVRIRILREYNKKKRIEQITER